MSAVIFFIAAIGAVAGAFGVATLRNPFYNVLALVVHLLCLAALFLLLNAQFVAAAQVVVYAGAVMVLYVFVVAYVGGQGEPMGMTEGSGLRGIAVLFCGALFIELCFAFLGSGLQLIDTRGRHVGVPEYGGPGRIGEALLTKYLFPFEAASILLLVAAVGAVILARRRRGLPEVTGAPERLELPLPAYAGTMIETVAGRTSAEEPAAGAATAGEPPFRGGW